MKTILMKILMKIYPFSGWSAIALGSCMSSWMTVVIRLPSRSDIAMELVPVSVLKNLF